jgi:hypothetical protein
MSILRVNLNKYSGSFYDFYMVDHDSINVDRVTKKFIQKRDKKTAHNIWSRITLEFEFIYAETKELRFSVRSSVDGVQAASISESFSADSFWELNQMELIIGGTNFLDQTSNQ